MIDFYSRVEEIREDKKLNKKSFANLLNMQNSNYATLLKGKNINGELSNLLKKEFDINLNWLISGVGDMYENDIDSSCDYICFLEQRITEILQDNKRLHTRQVAFLPALTQRRLEFQTDIITHYLNEIGKNYQIINASNKTKNQIYKEFFTNIRDLKDIFYNTNKIYIIQNISNSKIAKKEQGLFIRSIIKVNDDAHFNKIIPQSDFIFIEHCSFIKDNAEILDLYFTVI